VIRGTIICESLAEGTSLDHLELTVVKLARYQVASVPEYQPSVRTLLEFEASDTAAETLDDALAGSLMTPGWYANWNSEDEATVVFPGKVFRYRRGDPIGRADAQAHGRQLGVPEPQLDWDE